MATNKNLTDFTQFKLWEYNKYKSINNGLWSFFLDNFEVFSINILLKVYIILSCDKEEYIYIYIYNGETYNLRRMPTFLDLNFF